MVVRQSKKQTIMRKTNYISPEVTLLNVEVEQGFVLSDPAGVNVGIGGWDADSEDYGGDAW